MASSDDRILWERATPRGVMRCVMVSCCSGAELQVVVEDEIVLRELYPTRSDLYERAREIEARSGADRDDPAGDAGPPDPASSGAG